MQKHDLPEDGHNRHRFGNLSRGALVRAVCLDTNRLCRQCCGRFIAV